MDSIFEVKNYHSLSLKKTLGPPNTPRLGGSFGN
jgi:hypothetical protein